MSSKSFFSQLIPLLLTVVLFIILSLFIYIEIALLNHFSHSDIVLKLLWQDILIGMTIYLKTSVDFALFIGNLMSRFAGMRNRIAIELGTAVGNALGTMLILMVWIFFRNVNWLLAIMIIVAALVLLRLAEDSFEHVDNNEIAGFFARNLKKINHFFNPLLNKIIPNISMKSDSKKLGFVSLFGFAFTVPFILGLDDFAGYVPLFNIVHVFGFAIGVLLGHMVLNIFLFLSPQKTIRVVKNSTISIIGGIAFILLAVWGLHEAILLLINP